MHEIEELQVNYYEENKTPAMKKEEDNQIMIDNYIKKIEEDNVERKEDKPT